MTERPRVCTTTGFAAQYLPPGPECDDVLLRLRLGSKFAAQHQGRRPGFLSKALDGIVLKIGRPVTFKRVLEEIESACWRRDRDGEAAGPFERVNHVWKLVTYHDPRRGRVQVTFATLGNKVTACKKNLPP